MHVNVLRKVNAAPAARNKRGGRGRRIKVESDYEEESEEEEDESESESESESAESAKLKRANEDLASQLKAARKVSAPLCHVVIVCLSVVQLLAAQHEVSSSPPHPLAAPRSTPQMGWPSLSGGFSLVLTPQEQQMQQQVQANLLAMQLLMRGSGGFAAPTLQQQQEKQKQ
jgi:hypothetical protein